MLTLYFFEMAEVNATILIPDISGFTEFMTSTELSHDSFAINMLIDAIITAVGDDYEVSEIEGDAGAADPEGRGSFSKTDPGYLPENF